MTRSQLEHAIRAACNLLGTTELIVVGSQSILGTYPKISGPLSESNEVDILPNLEVMTGDPTAQQAADILNGGVGEGSEFEFTHKFIIEGVTEEDLTLPPGWRNRTKPVCNPNTNGCTGHCLEPYDMATAKLAAGRHKDKEALINLIRQGIIKTNLLKARAETLSESQLLDGTTVADLTARLGRWNKLATKSKPIRKTTRDKSGPGNLK